jgi:small conductance mechanosensitive channel
VEAIRDRFVEVFSLQPLADYVVGTLLPNLLVAAATLAAFYVLFRAIDRALVALFERASVDLTAQSFVRSVTKYTLFVIAAVTALGQVGINTGSVVASLGVAGLTVGFAARDALSNIISGPFIFWDRPFVVGDFIEINGQYGAVKDITMRSTRVVTVDGKLLAIPNSQVVNSTVASYTNFPNLRLDIDVAVGVEENLAHVRKVLLDLVAQDPRFLAEPAPTVVVTALNDYNVALQLRIWLEDERQHIPVRFELRERVFLAPRDAGVTMPYETIQLSPIDLAQSDTTGVRATVRAACASG